MFRTVEIVKEQETKVREKEINCNRPTRRWNKERRTREELITGEGHVLKGSRGRDKQPLKEKRRSNQIERRKTIDNDVAKPPPHREPIGKKRVNRRSTPFSTGREKHHWQKSPEIVIGTTISTIAAHSWFHFLPDPIVIFLSWQKSPEMVIGTTCGTLKHSFLTFSLPPTVSKATPKIENKKHNQKNYTRSCPNEKEEHDLMRGTNCGFHEGVGGSRSCKAKIKVLKRAKNE
ncbi:hypothetical protein LXL04_035654 [Taraxacum kok-saghyz]